MFLEVERKEKKRGIRKYQIQISTFFHKIFIVGFLFIFLLVLDDT